MMWQTLLESVSRPLREGAYRLRPESGAEVVQMDLPLEPHERRLLAHYQGDTYQLFNYVMKYGVAPSNWFAYTGKTKVGVDREGMGRMALGATKVLRRLFSRARTTDDLIVYRGVEHYREFGAAGEGRGTFPRYNVDTANADRLQTDLRSMQAKLNGYTYTYKKFVSTSRHVTGARPFVLTNNPTMLWRFLVPGGSPALDLTSLLIMSSQKNGPMPKSYSVREREREILFPPGTTAQVRGVHVAHPSLDPRASTYWRAAYKDKRLSYSTTEVETFYREFGLHEWNANDSVEVWRAWPIYLVTAELNIPRISETEPLPVIPTNDPETAPDAGMIA